jgi:hypothetical protein
MDPHVGIGKLIFRSSTEHGIRQLFFRCSLETNLCVGDSIGFAGIVLMDGTGILGGPERSREIGGLDLVAQRHVLGDGFKLLPDRGRAVFEVISNALAGAFRFPFVVGFLCGEFANLVQNFNHVDEYRLLL